MSLRSISILAIPVLFLACGGSDAPSAVDAPATGGVRAPLDSATTPRATSPASSPSPSATPASSASTPAVDAQQLVQAQLAAASISLDQAVDTALAANPGSRLLEADLDGAGDNVRYEIELALADGSVVEVHVDATTGDIIATRAEDSDDDDDDDVRVDCTGAISALEAQEIAEAEASGTAVEVEIDDGCEFEVTVETATGFVEVEINPDGSVRQIENDDDGPDSEDDDDDDDRDSDGDDD
ncbi:MAG TPA: PepSY domain-containing protein [Polyangiaceae bacterium]|nr:PepSY domain-containing protein [Polyangiaceae bacterium]